MAATTRNAAAGAVVGAWRGGGEGTAGWGFIVRLVCVFVWECFVLCYLMQAFSFDDIKRPLECFWVGQYKLVIRRDQGSIVVHTGARNEVYIQTMRANTLVNFLCTDENKKPGHEAQPRRIL